MKVVLAHSYYRQRGGEDATFDGVVRLLRGRGHTVVELTTHNESMAALSRVRAAGRTIWNGDVARRLRATIRQARPDVVHVVNTFPALSPAVLWAARGEGVPVVQGLHNYRLVCAAATLFRDGRPCRACVASPVPVWAVTHGCYRGRAASAAVATMMSVHGLAGTWTRTVDLYYTTSEAARRLLVEGGVPADRLVVKPNFVDPDPGAGTGAGGYALFAGRLAPEKGVSTMLDAWRRIEGDARLKIAGDGPCADEVRAAAAADPRIEWLGQCAPGEVLDLMGDAAFVLVPSVWEEPFGRSVIEAFARGAPVVGTRAGALPEIVTDGRTGLLVPAADPAALAAAAQALLRDLDTRRAMGAAARAEYLARFTGDAQYPRLRALYERAADLCAARRSR